MSTAASTWTPADFQERTGKLLLPQHHEQLIASGISLEVAATRGYFSATRRRELRDLGFSDRQQETIRDAARSLRPTATLVVPLWWLDSQPVLFQVRPDEPRRDRNGKALKYETPGGAGVHLDIHPSMRQALGSPDLPLLITEGIKKDDAATTAGLCCVGLLGVDTWRGKNDQGGSTALGQWNDVHLKQRRVYICFDSDVMAKSSVYLALLTLRRYLESRGADVHVIYLPSGDGGAKVGLDDFLAGGATRDDLLALATKQIRHPDQPRSGDESWEVGEFRMDSGGTYLHTNSKEESWRMVADFAACIERKDIEDDDGPAQRHDGRDGQERMDSQQYHLVIRQGKQQVRHVVTAAAFHAMHWPPEVAALDLVVSAGGSTREYLREAIEKVSKAIAHERGHAKIPRRTVFVHTGWRVVNGRYVYLHAGGGIGPEGVAQDVAVRLEPQLQDYYLPPPPDGEELATAVRASLSLLELAPDEVMVPSLGAVYRTPLGPADFAVHSTGNSDRFKSEVAALLQQHFGDAWHGKNLPLAWVSSGNAIEGILHQAKEAFVVCDDFMPAGMPRADRDKMMQAATRAFRAQGNRAGRTRMRADTKMRATKFPRGLLYSTGEELPAGFSQIARVWVITQEKDAIPSKRLSVYQERTPLYAPAMAGYVPWLAPRMGDMAADVQTKVAQLRELYPAAHRRTSDIAANLEIGWSYFLAFAVECGAITTAERAAYEGHVRAGLLAGIKHQAKHQRDNKAAEKYIRGLQAAIASGTVHVTGPLGKEPENPDSWGWRCRTVGGGQYIEERWEPRGPRIGWLDGETLFLLPGPAFNAASAMYSEGLGIGEAPLRAVLRDDGLLLGVDGDGEHLTIKAPRTVDPTQPRVLRMRSDLTAGLPGSNGSSAGNGTSPNGVIPADGQVDGHLDRDHSGRTGISADFVVTAISSSKPENVRPNQGTDPGDPGDPGEKKERHTYYAEEVSEDGWEVGEV